MYKKTKKWFLKICLGALGLSLISTVSLTAGISQKASTQISENANKSDYEVASNQLNNVFDNFVTDINFSNLSLKSKLSSSINNEENIFEKIKNDILDVSNDYLNSVAFDQNKIIVKNETPILDNIKNYLEIHNYDSINFNNYMQQEKNNHISTFSNVNIFIKNGLVLHSYNSNQRVIDIANSFIKSGKDAFIVSLVAAAAAVGFWAASWWFGITIPWAIAAASASVSYAVQSAVFSFSGLAIKAMNSSILAEILNNVKILYDFKSYYEIIKNIRDVVKASKSLRVVQQATSWAVPIVNIVAAGIEFALGFANY